MSALLAFDTSTEMMAVALDGRAGRLHWNGPGGAQASTTLLPQIRRLLAQQQLGVAGLAAVAFGRGPGSFTGLRTACAVAQGLGFGAAVPVLPVDSLMVVAEDARQQVDTGTTTDVGVVMDARMGELYVARYAWSENGWTATMLPTLTNPSLLIDAWGGVPPPVIAGTGVASIRAAMNMSIAVEEVRDRADALARVARRMHERGLGVDAAAALPIYLRDKVAFTTAERLERSAQAVVGR